jgi:hypothetical protein
MKTPGPGKPRAGILSAEHYHVARPHLLEAQEPCLSRQRPRTGSISITIARIGASSDSHNLRSHEFRSHDLGLSVRLGVSPGVCVVLFHDLVLASPFELDLASAKQLR